MFLYCLKLYSLPEQLYSLQNNDKKASNGEKDTKYKDRKMFSIREKLGVFY